VLRLVNFMGSCYWLAWS